MTAFAYRAVDALGRPHKGVVEAPSAAGARRTLREQALLPVSIAPGRADHPRHGAPSVRPSLFAPRLGGRNLAVLTRQLATLVDSDVRVEEALRLVARQSSSRHAASLLLDLRASVLEGRSLAESLGEHAKAFPQFYRASVSAGERSGRLAEVLNHLADFVENRQHTAQKVQLALLYPALLALASGAMITLLMIYIVPGMVKVFVSRGADLPLLTRALIAISDGVRAYGLGVAAAGLVGLAAGAHWLKRPENRLKLAKIIAETPPLSRFSRQLNAARFAASLATLVRSEVPLVDALAAAAAVTPNAYIRQQSLVVAARVQEGAGLQQAMSEAGCFPSMLLAIVSSGESSGRLGKALGKASEELDREVQALTAALVALAEPAILLVMGGLVLLLVLAILLPIVNLSGLVGQ